MTAITGKPAYRQVADDLLAEIGRGTYPVGSSLPSTAQLTRTYSVSVTVVRAAIRELQNAGFVIGQPGKGVYVRTLPEEEPDDVTTRLDELTEAVRKLDARVSELEAERPPSDR